MCYDFLLFWRKFRNRHVTGKLFEVYAVYLGQSEEFTSARRCFTSLPSADCPLAYSHSLCLILLRVASVLTSESQRPAAAVELLISPSVHCEPLSGL